MPPTKWRLIKSPSGNTPTLMRDRAGKPLSGGNSVMLIDTQKHGVIRMFATAQDGTMIAKVCQRPEMSIRWARWCESSQIELVKDDE